jgi:phage tail sheath protein FI
MALNIGINVLETEGTASPAIAGAATSVAGFCISTLRGIPNRPTFVTSFAQFVERFGGFDTDSLGAHLVKGFFDNGGRRAWICRVASAATDPGPSHGTLRQSTANNSAALLTVQGGYRGAEDPGPWADGIQVHAAPSFTAAVASPNPQLTATTARLESVAGFTVGDRVTVAAGDARQGVTISAIDPGTHTLTWSPSLDNVGNFPPAQARVASTDIDVWVTAAGDDDEVLERFPRLSLDDDAANYAVPAINDSGRGSKWITVTDARQTGRNADGAPAGEVAATLDGGTYPDVAPTDVIGDENVHTGLRCFDPIDIQLLTTELGDTAVVRSALDYCAARGDCTFVGSVPQASVSAGTAIEYGAGFQGAKVYGALNGPWILVVDPLSRSANPTIWVPPSGHVMGVYARIEATRGIHKAPAGDEARLFGALDVEYRLSDAEHTDLVERGSVNGIRVVPGAGIVVDASRSLSTDIRWRYINVRLLFNYVKSSLRQGLRWVRQEPNRSTLWKAVEHGSVRPFLLGLWRQGAFGSGEPDDVFTVVCDETNNPPDEVDKGNFTVEVTFYPSKPAETIVIKVGQQPSGSSAVEA